MKLATAIKTLEQQFGFTNVQYSKNNYGQHKPYSFYMLTDDYYIVLVHPGNRRTHTNFVQHSNEWFPQNIDWIVDAKRMFVSITPRTDNAKPYSELFVESIFDIKRGDVDFLKNLLSPIA